MSARITPAPGGIVEIDVPPNGPSGGHTVTRQVATVRSCADGWRQCLLSDPRTGALSVARIAPAPDGRADHWLCAAPPVALADPPPPRRVGP